MIKKLGKSRRWAYILEGLVSVCGIIFLVLTLCGIRDGHVPNGIPIGSQYSSAIVALVLGVAVMAIERLFKYEFPLVLHAIIFSYILLSVVIGSCVGVFRMVDWYDKVLHGLLGYVLCILAMYIAIKCKIWNKSFAGNLWIMFAISMAYASIWEIFEFFCDTFLGQDMQRGPLLLDTMLDMCAHFVVTIIFMVHYVVDVKTKLNLGIDFMARNLATGGSTRIKEVEISTANGIDSTAVYTANASDCESIGQEDTECDNED